MTRINQKDLVILVLLAVHPHDSVFYTEVFPDEEIMTNDEMLSVLKRLVEDGLVVRKGFEGSGLYGITEEGKEDLLLNLRTVP